jgi:hypothetical protein
MRRQNAGRGIAASFPYLPPGGRRDSSGIGRLVPSVAWLIDSETR